MGLIGVNSVSDAPNRPTTLDRIATGVKIATDILGTGAQLYNTYQNTKTANANIEQGQEHMALEESDRGYMPVSSSLFQGKDPNSLSDQEIAQHNSQIPRDQLGNPLAPTLVRLSNNKVRALTPGYGNFSPLDKAITDQVFKYNTLANVNDRDAAPLRLPTGQVFMIKPTPLTTAERASTQTANQKSFGEDQRVKDYNNIYPQAASALTVAKNLANGMPVDKNAAIGLTASFLKTLTPGGEGVRINGDGILDVQNLSQTKLQQLHEQLANLGVDSTQPITGLSMPAAIGMINQIQSREQISREGYDSAYLDFQNTASTNRVPFQVRPAPRLQFPDLSNIQPNQNSANGNPPTIGNRAGNLMKQGLDYMQGRAPNPAPAPANQVHPADNIINKYGLNPR